MAVARARSNSSQALPRRVLGLADNRSPFEAPLIRGLARHGYEVDRNLTIERRGGQRDRVAQFVAEVVASKVDLIVAVGYASALAAKQGTTLPVVVFSPQLNWWLWMRPSCGSSQRPFSIG